MYIYIYIYIDRLTHPCQQLPVDCHVPSKRYDWGHSSDRLKEGVHL